jgi:predicted XRE-type DNA-binding protein
MIKKIEPRLLDTRRTVTSGNVFLDLGFDQAEAKIMALRAEVTMGLEQHLKAQNWTLSETAQRLGITQQGVSRLLNGQSQGISLDRLLLLAARAGLELRLHWAA